MAGAHKLTPHSLSFHLELLQKHPYFHFKKEIMLRPILTHNLITKLRLSRICYPKIIWKYITSRIRYCTVTSIKVISNNNGRYARYKLKINKKSPIIPLATFPHWQPPHHLQDSYIQQV